ncbi:hypothetical protein CC78DRAFT_574832 [Lojkania enalia]|uniref:Ankyrin repeat protein n=1 Tax=Lojkania enalia TaxID=147567 RepID=A0A9P4TPA5_9PLEO|nr:hypothetical protein CC78DRAFT_574832 [Didymosphaeria enalia]
MPPYTYRVEKRKARQRAGVRRGRGRQSDWSTSWQKKLIVLRLCGVKLNKIVKILNVLGDSTFTAKERRAQQILRELLSDDYHKFFPANKSTARKRAAFLKSVSNGYRKHPAHRNHSRAHFTFLSSKGIEVHVWHEEAIGVVNRLSFSKDVEESTMYDVVCAATQAYNEAVRHTPTPPLSPSSTSYALYKALLDSIRMLIEEKYTTESKNACQAPRTSTDNSSNSTDRKLPFSENNRQIRRILRTESCTSSFVSDIMGAVGGRFSISTIATSGSSSVFSPSMFGGESEAPSIRANIRATYAEHLRQIEKANASLISMCCSETSSCIHKQIRDIICSGTQLTQYQLDLGIALKSNSCDAPTLFFTARAGAPADVVLAVIDCSISLNELNNDGQTFLFSLNPQGFHGSVCRCKTDLPHASRFECLIARLDERSFDFDRIDHDGRHFLSLLSTSPDFDLQWLLSITSQSREWSWRIRSFSRFRDASGAFLIDYVAQHPKYSEWPAQIFQELRIPFTHMSAQWEEWIRIEGEEDGRGETELHELFQNKLFVRSQAPLTLTLTDTEVRAKINRYDRQGRTPLMSYLSKACEENIPEQQILSTVKRLVDWGANPKARSRNGSTILHFAAQKAYPELLLYALSTGLDVNQTSNAGLTALDFTAVHRALDYAGSSFNKTRSRKAPPELTVRSLKMVTRLLDYATSNFTMPWTPKPTKGQPPPESYDGPTEQELAARSAKSITMLMRHNADTSSYSHEIRMCLEDIYRSNLGAEEE